MHIIQAFRALVVSAHEVGLLLHDDKLAWSKGSYVPIWRDTCANSQYRNPYIS